LISSDLPGRSRSEAFQPFTPKENFPVKNSEPIRHKANTHVPTVVTALKLALLINAMLLLPASSCRTNQTEQQAATPTPPVIAFLAVAKPDPKSDAPRLAFQDKYGGQTVMFDIREADRPKILGSFDDVAIAPKYEESGPPFAKCIPANPEDLPATATGGPPGTARLPGNYPSVGFNGSAKGGCGTWSTAVCNRVLGETDGGKAVDQAEWNEIAKAIGQDANGASRPAAVDAYYRDKGFCVQTKKYDGSTADQTELNNKLVTERCDVKLLFYTTNPTPPPALINGHRETVTGVSAQGIQTNSWGQDGLVKGGSSGGFSHSRYPVYPANGTTVFVSYVCKCGFFQKLFGG
jgi:hypothetical protein